MKSLKTKKRLRKVERQQGKSLNEKRQNLDLDSKHGKRINKQSKISNVQRRKARLQSVKRPRLCLCRNVGMTQGPDLICLTKTPRGPRVQSLVRKSEGRGPHSSIFGGLLLLYWSSDSTRSVLPEWRRSDVHVAKSVNKAFVRCRC